MTYLVCADLHCHPWSQFSRALPNGCNSRLQHILDELHRMAEAARKAGARRIYIAGDLFHVRGQIKPSVYNPVWETLGSLSVSHDVTWRIIPGNHDLEGRDVTWSGSAISALSGAYPNARIEIVQDITVFDDDRVVMIPWIHEREAIKAALDEARDRLVKSGASHADYDVLMHCGISDVLANVPGHFHAPELAAWGFRRVFSGHYHARKSFCEGRVWSIGATTHQTWSDVGTRAGFLEVDENEVREYDSAAPSFIDFDPMDLDAARGNYVRVRGLELDAAEVEELREELLKRGAEGVVVHVAPKVAGVARAGVAAKGASLGDSVRAFIAAAGHDDRTRDVALEILREAEAAA